MPHASLLAAFLALFLGLAAAPAQDARADEPSPEEKLAKQLYLNASLRKARIPPLKEGEMRISGPLNSLGPYHFDGGDSLASLRGCTWTKSRFGVMGHDGKGGGSAWFYADMDERTGQVLRLVAYGNGACGRGSGLAFFAAAPLVGNFGDVEKGEFTLRATGPAISFNTQGGFEELFEWKVSIVITGAADLLTAANGAKIPVKYYLGGDEVVMEDKDPSGANVDSGRGTATVERYRKPDVIPTGKYVAPGLRGGAVIKRINDNTYSINVDIGDEGHSAHFANAECRPEGDMLVCPTVGFSHTNNADPEELVPKNVRIRQVGPGKITLDADGGVSDYHCDTRNYCFTGITYEKK